ncbi:hypothetical protein DSO57_1018073 [Entomophthora muscae]|uniref:Uncharacterized protein n=1 Tax=Entomophthora muscae TaxID=34485 RepID=A0ACC2S6H5_9FUNG|nr:hypothetical protein DSO57_1018073 [Entomophthora muscae]
MGNESGKTSGTLSCPLSLYILTSACKYHSRMGSLLRQLSHGHQSSGCKCYRCNKFKALGGNQTHAQLPGGWQGFASKSKNPGAGINPVLATAVRPVLFPKSYAQALVGLAGPEKANFSFPGLPV